jgi:hypothetical protein
MTSIGNGAFTGRPSIIEVEGETLKQELPEKVSSG